MKPRIILAATAATVGMAGLAVAAWKLLRPDREHYEEPAYTVDSTHEDFEVRTYEATIQAQVTVEGDRNQATQQGFRILAGYIFGGNQAQRSISMTAPVSTSPESQTIAMTTPVSASPTKAGWTVGFTMPSRWTLDTLPVPDDARVELVPVPAHRAAVRSFSGRANESRVQDEERALRSALADQGVQAEPEATVAQFDPPWVLGPWRRNEIQIGLN